MPAPMISLGLAVVALMSLLNVVLAVVPVATRLEINTLIYEQEYSRMRDLYLQAMLEIQEMPYDDPDSFFAIGMIHGEAAIPYRGVVNESHPFTDVNDPNRWYGYCDHSGTIFPTWHRPYVLILEQTLAKRAKAIAKQYKHAKKDWKEAARNLRFPYWDWAAASLKVDKKFPPILIEKTVEVRTPSGRKEIRNPLFSALMHSAIGVNQSSWDLHISENPDPLAPINHTQWPYPKYNYAMTETTRHPYYDPATGWQTNTTSFVATMVDDRDAPLVPIEAINTNNKEVIYLEDGPMPNVYSNMVLDLMSIESWRCFGIPVGHQPTEDTFLSASEMCLFTPLENIHNWIHDNIGGSYTIPPNELNPEAMEIGGHMGSLGTAGLDMIFFLHHTNVDRLLALWQAFRPGQFVIPLESTSGSYMYDKGQPLDSTSPLYPFLHPDNSGRMYSSIDVVSTERLGYTYPELESTPSSHNLYRTMTEKYSYNMPTGYRWWYMAACSIDVGENPDADVAITGINVSFTYNNRAYMYTASVTNFMLSGPLMSPKEGARFNKEITSILQAVDINTNIPPIDGDPAKGPSYNPIELDSLEVICITNAPDSDPVDCSCLQDMMWTLAAPLDDPYANYRGWVNGTYGVTQYNNNN